MKQIVNGLYRHYKGNYYRVLGVGTHTETQGKFVIYQDSAHKIWLRPEKMFNERVNGIPRFSFVKK